MKYLFICLIKAIVFILIITSADANTVFSLSIDIEALSGDNYRLQKTECYSLEEFLSGNNADFWITIGKMRINSEGNTEIIGHEITCQNKLYDEPYKLLQSEEFPYLIANVSVIPSVSIDRIGVDKNIFLSVALSKWEMTDFVKGKPLKYNQKTEKKNIYPSGSEIIFLTLNISNEGDNRVLGPLEAVMGIRLNFAKQQGTTEYGDIYILSDMVGGEVFLDGWLVDRIPDEKELILKNITTGKHEISIKDSSGHDFYRVVNVEKNRQVMVSLKKTEKNLQDLIFIGKNDYGYKEYLRMIDGIVVVKIPAGEFLMGNKDSERQPMEHKVYVSEFLMDKTPVTWGKFKIFAAETIRSLPPSPYWGIHDNHPVVFVTWEEANAYCQWAGGRLPSEAEREKAARGTDGRKYPWGNEEPNPKLAVFRRNWGDIATDPVGMRPKGASPYGLLDMAGNVWEWCADWYDEKYYEISPYMDPKGPSSGRFRVVRGGSWDSRPDVLNSSVRNWGHRGYREGDFGFRCAMDPID